MRKPLASRIRPQILNDIIGQAHIIGPNKIINNLIENQTVFSMIFFGPPGTGKTTLAQVLASELNINYSLLNAVTGNKKDLDNIFMQAKMFDNYILVIDEVHRLNKDKQDLLLPYIEEGTITIIGATTANPYHSINPAIRSRCHLFEFKSLNNEDICKAIDNALSKDEYLSTLTITDEAKNKICKLSNGDVRYCLNLLELCSMGVNDTKEINIELVNNYIHSANNSFDKNEDGHYDLLSAFQKSIRGSDVNAALYYLSVLIQGNDLASIERRLLVTAYEDIGLANPAAISRTINAIEAAKIVGFPEGRIPLSVAIIDLCLSPKSKSAENAINCAMTAAKYSSYKIPEYLKYTPVGKNADEVYDYTREDVWPKLQYLPDSLADAKFYIPEDNKYENMLSSNYAKINKTKRSNDIKKLLREK